MKTFNTIVKSRKNKMYNYNGSEESKWILQSLVNITLNYKLSGNIGMYNHSIK